MALLWKANAALAALGALLQVDCAGPAEYAVHRFALPACPDAAFALPSAAEEKPYRLWSRKPHWWSDEVPRSPIPGFTAYRVRGASASPPPVDLVYARLTRGGGAACGLDVAFEQSAAGPARDARALPAVGRRPRRAPRRGGRPPPAPRGRGGGRGRRPGPGRRDARTRGGDVRVGGAHRVGARAPGLGGPHGPDAPLGRGTRRGRGTGRHLDRPLTWR